MTGIISTLLHEPETTGRLARVLLKHVGPKDRDEAIDMLYKRIGVYACDRRAITREVDHYFK